MSDPIADDATTVDDVDVDLTDEEPPPGDLLSDDETAAIEEAVAAINASNSGRTPDEQVSTDPSLVS